MHWTVSRSESTRTAGDLLVVVTERTAAGADLAPLAARGDDPRLGRTVAAGGHDGSVESWLALPVAGVRARWTLLVGAGVGEEITPDVIRRVAGVAAQRARAMKARTVVLALDLGPLAGLEPQSVARCWVEGAEMALSAAVEGAAGDDGEPLTWKLAAAGANAASGLREGVRQGEAYAEGCLRARWLVNLPPNRLTPAQLAAEARKVARSAGYRCRVLDAADLARLRMGGLLGVGQGSRNRPHLAILESRTLRRGAPRVALVGKGITFDSGGISIKPAARMEQMKADMAGAAAVLGAALILARLEVPVNLVAAIPTAENLPGGGAIRPADVLTMASGKTVEVINTDAEGRLILADALHHVCRGKPDYVIDIATLTGACVVALGQDFAGLLGTSGRLIEVLEQAGGETFERVWPLPLIAAHQDELKSQVADLRNVGGRDGGALTAAAFLANFVPEGVDWAHVDIAGPAWTDKPGPLGPKGGTGFGARLLARAVEILVG